MDLLGSRLYVWVVCVAKALILCRPLFTIPWLVLQPADESTTRSVELKPKRGKAVIPSFPQLLLFSGEIRDRKLPFDPDSSCYSHPYPLTKPFLSLTLFSHQTLNISPFCCRNQLCSRLPGFARYYSRMSKIYWELIKLCWAVMKKEERREAGIYFGRFLGDSVCALLLLSHREKTNLHRCEVSQDRPAHCTALPPVAVISC